MDSTHELVLPYQNGCAEFFQQGKKHEDGKYKRTIDLPRTAFGLRANSVVREPKMQKIWDENQVFERVSNRNTGGALYSMMGLLMQMGIYTWDTP